MDYSFLNCPPSSSIPLDNDGVVRSGIEIAVITEDEHQVLTKSNTLGPCHGHYCIASPSIGKIGDRISVLTSEVKGLKNFKPIGTIVDHDLQMGIDLLPVTNDCIKRVEISNK